MRITYAGAVILLFAACGEGKPSAEATKVSREPISVRGWIADIDTDEAVTTFKTVETQAAKRIQNFQATNLWVENAPYVSGGVAETGAFILLDVPPGKTGITFSAPGIPSAVLLLENVPANADVLVPGMILKRGGVTIAEPRALQVRLAARVAKPTRTGLTARIAGNPVAVMQVPINDLIDRRDYPNAPRMGASVATVK